MKKYLVLIAVFYLYLNAASAQKKAPFWDDVQTIKNYDKLFKAPDHPIVFTGSSSIRKWDDLQWSFAKYHALNRGIGGAVVDDITYYLDDVVFAYNPRQIVIYVGENDLVNEKNTADSVLNKTIRLFQAIRAKAPEIPIVYLGMKPSPSRDKYQQKCIDANKLIRQYISTDKNAKFVDIFALMISKEGKSRPELFGKDMLHMNKVGYAIWEKAVKPYLLKE